ncbi:hypothetical protein BTN50_0098 [Candidatus Enterovibrio altilux]|uniref:Mobile element protein n=1 Tax=Candidatus Enterovibrio altilux TaxID=1927128 RepID=A0A291B6L5_9GAMM|nr:hypothetical protein BTN50_0098 [Candidatus Enterovibrio luxaltus]
MNQKITKSTLNLSDHNTYINETSAMIKALHKLTELGIPKTKVIV